MPKFADGPKMTSQKLFSDPRGRGMTRRPGEETVNDYLRESPFPNANAPNDVAEHLIENPGKNFCEDCLGTELGVDPYYARKQIKALKGNQRFKRRREVCSVCKNERHIVMAREPYR